MKVEAPLVVKSAEAGEFIITARRKEQIWYLGGMTNETEREIVIPLEMLPSGEHEAQVYVDGSLDKEKPNEIRIEYQAVTTGTHLRVIMASGGGFVAVISPKNEEK